MTTEPSSKESCEATRWPSAVSSTGIDRTRSHSRVGCSLRPTPKTSYRKSLLAAYLGLRKLRDAHVFNHGCLGSWRNLARTRLRQHREGHFDDYAGGRALSDFNLDDAEPSPELIHQTKELHRIISDAIGALPAEQQQTVRLHYVEGLKLREIAILTGSPLGTIKARLHHARERLRVSLASQLEIALEPDRSGGIPMVEVVVHDVVIRSPKGEEAKWLAEGTDYNWDTSA